MKMIIIELNALTQCLHGGELRQANMFCLTKCVFFKANSYSGEKPKNVALLCRDGESHKVAMIMRSTDSLDIFCWLYG